MYTTWCSARSGHVSHSQHLGIILLSMSYIDLCVSGIYINLQSIHTNSYSIPSKRDPDLALDMFCDKGMGWNGIMGYPQA